MAETAVEVRNKEMAQNAWGLLEKMKPSIAAVLPRHLTPERMAMIAFTAMRRTPELMKCSPQSIIGSIMTASMLGLEPSGPLGHGALIPYKGECQFQPMYQGLLELARRSGFVKDVQCRAVYKGDHYVYRFGLDPTIEHIPLEGDGADNPNRECTHVYCIIRFTNGGIQWDQMSFAQGMAHGKRFSKTWDGRVFKDGTPWKEHPVAMCLKTILKQTLKLCPKSPELAAAMSVDDMGEIGKTANTRRLTDGSFDVDFGDDPTDLTDEGAGTSAIDRIVQQKQQQESAASTHAQNGGNGKASEPSRAAEVCTRSDFDQIEILATETGVRMRQIKEHVTQTMGFETYGMLTQVRLPELQKWIEAQRKTDRGADRI